VAHKNETDEAAVSGEKGESIDYEIEIASDTRLYQITETGLTLQATLQGIRYRLDEKLN
jgi:hypothetical protein